MKDRFPQCRVPITGSGMSCGVHVIATCNLKNYSAFQDHKDIALDWAKVRFFRAFIPDSHHYGFMGPCAMYLFSDADRYGNGLKLAALIKELGFGPLHETPPIRNPNSGNDIRVWVWYIDRESIAKWVATETKRLEELSDVYEAKAVAAKKAAEEAKKTIAANKQKAEAKEPVPVVPKPTNVAFEQALDEAAEIYARDRAAAVDIVNAYVRYRNPPGDYRPPSRITSVQPEK